MDAPNPERDADAAAARRRVRLAGIAFISVAVASFTVLDTTAKYLTSHMHQMQVSWGRYMSAFVLTLLLFNPVTRPNLVRTNRLGLQILRGVLLCLSTACSFMGLRYLHLDESSAIIFAGPFIIAALSGPMLGEWIGPRRWAAIAVGFLGVLLVTRPGLSGIHPAAAFTVGSAVCYAFYAIVTRVLARTDSDQTTLFYSNFVGAVLLFLPLPFVWSTPDSWAIVLLMLMTGVFGSFGHYMMIAALRRAPATVISPFMYSQLVWMVIAGYFVFGRVPDAWAFAGISLIIGSGVYLIHREQVRRGDIRPPV